MSVTVGEVVGAGVGFVAAGPVGAVAGARAGRLVEEKGRALVGAFLHLVKREAPRRRRRKRAHPKAKAWRVFDSALVDRAMDEAVQLLDERPPAFDPARWPALAACVSLPVVGATAQAFHDKWVAVVAFKRRTKEWPC